MVEIDGKVNKVKCTIPQALAQSNQQRVSDLWQQLASAYTPTGLQ